MPKSHKILVRVNVEISEAAIQTIVQLAKAETGPDHRGAYHVDTAEKVGATISDFLETKDFDGYLRQLSASPGTSG